MMPFVLILLATTSTGTSEPKGVAMLSQGFQTMPACEAAGTAAEGRLAFPRPATLSHVRVATGAPVAP